MSIRTAIYQAHQAFSAAYEAELKKAGLTITGQQASVLIAMLDEDRPSQTDLVNRTGIDRSTMADIVPRLKGKGLIARTRSRSDARTYEVSLTAEGKRVAVRAMKIEEKLDRRVLDLPPATNISAQLQNARRAVTPTLEAAE